MMEKPSRILEIEDAIFSFDESMLAVTVEVLKDSKLDWQTASAADFASDQKRAWLQEWVQWLDREVNAFEGPVSSETATQALRRLYDCARTERESQVSWLKIGDLPILPKRAAVAYRLRWLPGPLRRIERKHTHSHRQKMASWLDTQIETWEETRANALDIEEIERPFEANLRYLRRQIEQGRLTIDIRSALRNILGLVSRNIELAALRVPDQEKLIIELDLEDQSDLLSARRHLLAQGLNGLAFIDGKDMRRQRLGEIAYRVAAHIAEILQVTHCQRNQVALVFMLSQNGERKPVLGLTFKAPELYAYRREIAEMLRQHRLPNLPICKNHFWNENNNPAQARNA